MTAPGADSGTFDYFNEVIIGKGNSSRGDYTASEDDNVLVQGVANDKNALGYFGLAYYLENKDKIRAVAVDGVLPSPYTVNNGRYTPLSRPIFIYVNKDAADNNPAVKRVVIVTTREALRAIPNNLRETAYALGASKWQMIWDHILPYSFSSILTGAIGALTFIAFLPDSPFREEFPYLSFAWLQAPFTVMPIQMFNWVSRPIGMTLVMNDIAIYLRYLFRKGLK